MTVNELGIVRAGTPLLINMGGRRGETATVKSRAGQKITVQFDDGSSNEYSYKACGLKRVDTTVLKPAPVARTYERPMLKQDYCVICKYSSLEWDEAGVLTCPRCHSKEVVTEVHRYGKVG